MHVYRVVTCIHKLFIMNLSLVPNHVDEIDNGGPFVLDGHDKTFYGARANSLQTLCASAHDELSSTQAMVSHHVPSSRCDGSPF